MGNSYSFWKGECHRCSFRHWSPIVCTTQYVDLPCYGRNCIFATLVEADWRGSIWTNLSCCIDTFQLFERVHSQKWNGLVPWITYEIRTLIFFILLGCGHISVLHEVGGFLSVFFLWSVCILVLPTAIMAFDSFNFVICVIWGFVIVYTPSCFGMWSSLVARFAIWTWWHEGNAVCLAAQRACCYWYRALVPLHSVMMFDLCSRHCTPFEGFSCKPSQGMPCLYASLHSCVKENLLLGETKFGISSYTRSSPNHFLLLCR